MVGVVARAETVIRCRLGSRTVRGLIWGAGQRSKHVLQYQ
jgi:hypothetical protein